MSEDNLEQLKKEIAHTPIDTTPENPLPNQDKLAFFVDIIEQQVGKDHLIDYYINKLSKHVPTIIVKRDSYFQIAKCLKEHEQLQFDFISDLHGTDFQTHFEVYVYLCSFSQQQSVVMKVRVDREKPSLPSLTPLWEGANWPECEVFDLLGIQFTNHPDLKRILLGEEWIGYPLRKDYVPHDVEV